MHSFHVRRFLLVVLMTATVTMAVLLTWTSLAAVNRPRQRAVTTDEVVRWMTVRIVGAARLGNQMFAHASLLGLAAHNGYRPVVSVDDNRLLVSYFDLKTPVWSTARRRVMLRSAFDAFSWRTYNDGLPCGYENRSQFIGGDVDDDAMFVDKSVVLFGYFQSWRYFDSIRDDVRREFRFKESTVDAAHAFLLRARRKHRRRRRSSSWTTEPPTGSSIKSGYNGNGTSNLFSTTMTSTIITVGVHVRRDDMLSKHSVERGYTVATAEYLRRAVEFFEDRYGTDGRLLFVVCSDDLQWSRDNWPQRQLLGVGDDGERTALPVRSVEFSTASRRPEVDLAILSSCDHVIMTVGTFGWWAAFLAGGTTVYYKDFPDPGSPLAVEFRSTDFYYPSWIGLS